MKTLCRKGCGACCTEISISSYIPGMLGPKPAGVRCIHLKWDRTCALWGTDKMPKICKSFQADTEICGNCYPEAVQLIRQWEKLTS